MTAPLVPELDVSDLEAGAEVVVDLEARWYRQGGAEAGNRQFVVADPDGYLLRFFEDLGVRTRSLP